MNWRGFGRKPNRDLIQALSWHLPGGLRKTIGNLKITVVPAGIQTEHPPEYKSRALLVDQTVRFKIVILYIIMLSFL
jgi:hypothetical protein